MRRNRIMIILLLFALAACFTLWNNVSGVESTTVTGVDGVWDLRGFDFESGNAKLGGEVQYIPNALLTPEEFEAREDEAVAGYPEEAGQYATSRIRILLPDDEYYTFSVRSIDFCQRLYVNGEWFWDVGSPGETKESTVPDTSKMTFVVQAEDGVVEIVQQAANFVHREGGGHAGWLVGLPGTAQAAIQKDLEAAVIVGCYLALLLVHILLYVLLRRYRANLYFALLSLMWFLRSGVTGARIFSSLFPWLSWTVKFRIEYLAFPVTAVLLLLLLDTIYPHVLHKKFRYAMYGVSAVFAGLFLFTDTLFMSYALPVCEMIYIPAILYIIVRFIMKLRGANMEQTVFLAGVGLVFFSFVLDMFYYNNIIRFRILGSEWSMLLFAFFAAAAIFIATMRKVEEAKAEEQRLAAENAALDRLSRLRGNLMATVSHEMRTPLTVMSVYAQLAVETLREAGVDEQTAADLTMISGEAKRLADMAGGVLDMVSGQEDADARGPIDIARLVEQVARLCEPSLRKGNNRLVRCVEDGLPKVIGNAGECTQLLWNLLSNAARHTRDGEITVSAHSADGYVAVTVADTGEGIPDELLPRVFERRVTGDGEGAGLGLAICKEIVDAHGGTIGIESKIGKGSAVSFTLPSEKGGNDGQEGGHSLSGGQYSHTGGQ